MKLTVLNDNLASGICEGAHGLSFYIEADINILFDAGPSDIAFRNAEKLNKNIQHFDYFVLSHGHWDHGNGLEYINEGTLIAHPEIFRQRYKRSNKHSIGLDIDKKKLQKNMTLILTRGPMQLSEQCWYLGQIPRTNTWDVGHEDFILEDDTRDQVPDDSALVIKVQQSMVIISGCAHSGITNIILHAKSMFPKTPIKAVIGGFHLKPKDPRIEKTIQFIKDQNIEKIYPSHCTSVEAICKMRKEIDATFVRSGNSFRF